VLPHLRATGGAGILENGGTIENAKAIRAHESPRAMKLFDQTGDEITLDEVERIAIRSDRALSLPYFGCGVMSMRWYSSRMTLK
jgi:hypothetical protein